MSAGEEIGNIVVRLLVDDVSMKEVRLVLTHLRDRPELRERASTIGSLVEADDAQRQVCCDNMIDILLNWIDPLDKSSSNPIVDSHRYVRMGNDLLGKKFLQPLSRSSNWYGHVKRAGAKLYLNKGNECYITVELYEILVSIEELWGLQRFYTVRSRKMTEAEIQQRAMNVELQARGSKLYKA